jgi:hypothetical protein
VEKKELLFTVDGNVNKHIHSEEHYDDSSKTLKTELSCNPDVPVFGIYPKELKSTYQK